MRTLMLSLSAALLASLATYSATAGHERAHLQILLQNIDSTLQQGRFDGPTLDATEQDLQRVMRRLRHGDDGGRPTAGVARGGHGPALDLTALDRACDDVFSTPALETQCVVAMRRVSFDPRPALKACEEAMDGDSNEWKCIEAASRARFDPSAGVTACERAFNGDEMELRCIAASTRMWSNAAAIIAECERVFDGDERELQCITLAPTLGRNAVATLGYCEREKSGDDAEMACIQAFGSR